MHVPIEAKKELAQAQRAQYVVVVVVVVHVLLLPDACPWKESDRQSGNDDDDLGI